MTTRIEIINRAMIAIASRSDVASLTENTPEARQSALIYEPTRDAMLRAAPWNFARKMIYLTQTKAVPGVPGSTAAASSAWNPATMPAPPWLYQYAYPADCAHMRYIIESPSNASASVADMFSVPTLGPAGPIVGISPTPFAVATDNSNTVILSNVRRALGCYTEKVFSEARWDAQFQEAMVSALAARLGLSLTGNVQAVQLARSAALEAIVQARTADGNEGTSSVNRVPDWIAARSAGVADGTVITMSGANWFTPLFLQG
jgi:hypothetical protein